jgi:hypothetical protein
MMEFARGRVPGRRPAHAPPAGADPIKLTRATVEARPFDSGNAATLVHRDRNGRLKIVDGVTRATRVAKYLPGVLIRVQVTAEQPKADYSSYPTVGDTLP